MYVTVDRAAVASCLGAPEDSIEGLEAFVRLIEADDTWQDVRHVFYMIATVAHDTGGTFVPQSDDQPAECFEMYEPRTMRGCELGNRHTGDGFKYRKRGYVPMRGYNIYVKLGRALGVDLLTTPAMLDEPEMAYRALRVGMAEGLFTGHKLDAYIDEGQANYVEARRVINRLQAANIIGNSAFMMEQAGAVTYAEGNQR